MNPFNLKNASSQYGKIAIVTGANIGLGYETTKGLASKQVKVIMACRNQEKARKARLEILKEIPDADLEVAELDLDKMASIRAFSSAFMMKNDSLDLLINNAGIMIPPLSFTEDGFETQMGVNYLGHFLLTSLLLPALNKAEGARIVSLSSIAHKRANISFDNLNAEKGYSKFKAYGQSKLACLMFAYELQRKLAKYGSPVRSIAAHPGVSNTNLGQYLPTWFNFISPLFHPFFTHSPDKAALPLLYAALGNDIEGGDYCGPTGFNEMTGSPGKVKSTPKSYDKMIAQRLWEVSGKLVNNKFDFSF
jgi:NAD(P)-dependent dehydrogenase (short-subunit alcohol dehydrogenase family)